MAMISLAPVVRFPTCLLVNTYILERSNHDSPFEILKILVTKPSFARGDHFSNCSRVSIRSNHSTPSCWRRLMKNRFFTNIEE